MITLIYFYINDIFTKWKNKTSRATRQKVDFVDHISLVVEVLFCEDELLLQKRANPNEEILVLQLKVFDL